MPLEIRISIRPPAANPAEGDDILSKELDDFERYYAKKMHEAGYSMDGLSTPERVAVKGYLIYALETHGDGNA